MSEHTKGLTDKQRRALEWIRDYEHYQSGWNNNATVMTLTGNDGVIKIALEDWRALKGLFEADLVPRARRIWRINDAGLAALTKATQP